MSTSTRRITRNRVLNYDGIGFVNNIGASKYWGVSKNSLMNRWMVTIQQGYMDDGRPFNKIFYFEGCKGNEEHAAQIAAHMYSWRGDASKMPNEPFEVVTQDGTAYTLSPAHNSISRVTMRRKEPTKLPLEEITTAPVDTGAVQTSFNFKKEELAKLSPEEIELLHNLVSLYGQGKISKIGLSMIEGIVSAM